MALPSEVFDHFNYDYETFGELDEVAPWMQRVDSNVPYFSQSQHNFPIAPFPLPDSPTWEHPQQVQYYAPQHHPRRTQGYHPPQYRAYPMGGQGDVALDQEEGGSGQPLEPSREERLQQARLKLETYHSEVENLRRQLEAARDHQTGHASYSFSPPSLFLPGDKKSKTSFSNGEYFYPINQHLSDPPIMSSHTRTPNEEWAGQEIERNIWRYYLDAPPSSYSPPRQPNRVLVSAQPRPRMEDAHSTEPVRRLEAPAPRPPHLAPASWPMGRFLTHPGRAVTIHTSRFPSDSEDSNSDTPNPGPQSKSGSETPLQTSRPILLLLPDEQATPSTSMDQTMTGPPSPRSIEKFSAPITPRPGSYKDAMLKLTTISEAMTEPRWIGTLLSNKEIQSLEQDDRRPS
ncbi:hypothetical protein ARMSODRAFT_1016760 [Armillaria solidipes]|uniref:Uncharacterized protein n=1 Tax=Armillaria solidipes TaxID=1076256 RepID=A0A2H3BXR9_9AGAR|nr:hypothetical protein ARMSODRAFT_1016760 [Armillaria solidipes]